MRIEKLSEANIPLYIDYLKAALAEEPDMMTIDRVDAPGILARTRDTAGCPTASLLAIEDDAVIGRLEYHFYRCLQGGYQMAYVSWLYVSPAHRHKGIARALFRAFESQCAENGIDEYFLIQAKNESARRFYQSFPGASSTGETILRKAIK